MKSLWPHIDSNLSIFIEKNISHSLQNIASYISSIADVQNVLIITFLLVLYFILRKKWKNVVVLVGTVGLTAVIVWFMKDFFMVARPQNGLVTLLSKDSFPSGHASMAAAFFTALGIIYFPRITSKMYANLFLIGCLVAVLAIGISRLLLNVHWLSDVVIGWIIGVAVASLVYWFSLKWKIKN